jgi:hypothetical protein
MAADGRRKEIWFLTKLELSGFIDAVTGWVVTVSSVSDSRYRFNLCVLDRICRASSGPKTSSISKARKMMMP